MNRFLQMCLKSQFRLKFRLNQFDQMYRLNLILMFR
jgi:hypothetical protein